MSVPAGATDGAAGLRYDTISFLSDYGRTDEFVGVVHSVIRTLTPGATVIDITHDVPAHDVRAGGLVLARAAQYLTAGVVLAVVDPGVGTDRRGIAVEIGDGDSVLVGLSGGKDSLALLLFLELRRRRVKDRYTIKAARVDWGDLPESGCSAVRPRTGPSVPSLRGR